MISRRGLLLFLLQFMARETEGCRKDVTVPLFNSEGHRTQSGVASIFDGEMEVAIKWFRDVSHDECFVECALELKCRCYEYFYHNKSCILGSLCSYRHEAAHITKRLLKAMFPKAANSDFADDYCDTPEELNDLAIKWLGPATLPPRSSGSGKGDEGTNAATIGTGIGSGEEHGQSGSKGSTAGLDDGDQHKSTTDLDKEELTSPTTTTELPVETPLTFSDWNGAQVASNVICDSVMCSCEEKEIMVATLPSGEFYSGYRITKGSFRWSMFGQNPVNNRDVGRYVNTIVCEKTKRSPDIGCKAPVLFNGRFDERGECDSGTMKTAFNYSFGTCTDKNVMLCTPRGYLCEGSKFDLAYVEC